MRPDEQTDALAADIFQLVHRYQKEFDIQVETMVGVLEFVKQDLLTGGSVEFDCDMDLPEE